MARRRPSRSSLALRWISAAVLAAIALAYVHPLRSYLHARSEVDSRRADVARLVAQKQALTRQIAEAGTDEYVVREARMLGLVRPGERLWIVRGVEKPGLR
jgi:cell division protein FtsB